MCYFFVLQVVFFRLRMWLLLYFVMMLWKSCGLIDEKQCIGVFLFGCVMLLYWVVLSWFGDVFIFCIYVLNCLCGLVSVWNFMLEKLWLLKLVDVFVQLLGLLVIRCRCVCMLVIVQIWLLSCGMKNEFIIEFDVMWKFIGVLIGIVSWFIDVILSFGQMNSYFQLSVIILMLSGFIVDLSGLYGLSL